MTDYHTNQLTDVVDATNYMFGGNAIFTLVSKKTGARYTYQVKRGKKQTERGGYVMDETTPLFVRVLSGPRNTDDYMYIGFIPNDEQAKLIAGKKGRPEAPSYKALDWLLRGMAQHMRLPTTLEIWHEGTCCRCGRRLTVPESIESGIGPECAKKGL